MCSGQQKTQIRETNIIHPSFSSLNGRRGGDAAGFEVYSSFVFVNPWCSKWLNTNHSEDVTFELVISISCIVQGWNQGGVYYIVNINLNMCRHLSCRYNLYIYYNICIYISIAVAAPKDNIIYIVYILQLCATIYIYILLYIYECNYVHYSCTILHS